MDTRIFEYFVAIAKEGSLTKAAENLYVSQPALSQQLQKLEKEIGTPLFTRTGDGLQLTPAGGIFLNGAQSILFEKNQAYTKIEEYKQSTKQEL